MDPDSRNRLVRALPSHTSSHAALDLLYATVSYSWSRPAPELPDEWDDETSTRPVRLNGYEFSVRHNLHSLLEPLRDDVGLKGVAFWIDAQGIHQGNVAEKNVVVPRMAEIYAGSRQVHAANFAQMSKIGKLWGERSEDLRRTLISDDQMAAYAEVVRTEFPEDDGTRSWDAIQPA